MIHCRSWRWQSEEARAACRTVITVVSLVGIVAFPAGAQEPFLCDSNCVPLQAIVGVEAALGAPDEIDAFSFPGVVGGRAQLRTEMGVEGGPQLRMRVFDPLGNEIPGTNTCDRHLQVETPVAGIYALLVSACDGVATGEYFVGWRPMPLDLVSCGVTVTRQLTPGETDVFVTLSSEAGSVIDVTDVSGTIGLLRLDNQIGQFGGAVTCEGTLPGSLLYYLQVSDCVGEDEGTYALALNVTSDQPTNCGTPLTCGTAADGELSVGGQVDSFTLERSAGAAINVTAEARAGLAGGIRIRLFSPEGTELRDTCAASFGVTLAAAGRHTVLISACAGVETGEYSVRWDAAPACSAPPIPTPQATPGSEPPLKIPGGPLAYVLHTTTLGIVDTEANESRGLLTLGGSSDPPKLHLGANEAFLYVSVGEVLGISTSTNKITKRVRFIGENESRIAVHPNGSLLYSPSFIVEAVTVADVALGRITNLIFEEGITEATPLEVSRDGALLYVVIGRALFCINNLCPREPRIEVIDTTTQSSVATIPDERFRDAADVFIHPDGRRAYVTTGQILVVDADEQAIVSQIDIAARDVAFNADGSRAYATVDPSGVAVIDTATNTVLRTIDIAAFDQFGSIGMGGIAVSADSKFVLATHGRALKDQRGLVVIDAATEQVITAYPTGESYPADVVAVANPPDGLCVGDDSGQTKVTVGELVTAVNYALDGCPTDPQIPPPGEGP